ncbi:MAG: zinc finger CCCH domain-containing protein [Alphaproteobacteria bacterium]|nr:zinc finger CCCH domain-containing protein [Alphaproteobacteria bacterium]
MNLHLVYRLKSVMDTIENIENMTMVSDYDSESEDDIFVILTEKDREYAIVHRNFVPLPPPAVKRPDEAVIKTLVCQSIKRKIKCRFGEECTYAHRYSELRISPCKLRFCPWREPRPEPCPYIHEGESILSFNSRTEMHKHFPTEVQPPLPPMESKTSEPLVQQFQPPPTPARITPPYNSKYKTQLCLKRENCPYGPRCNFAHSLSELRLKN